MISRRSAAYSSTKLARRKFPNSWRTVTRPACGGHGNGRRPAPFSAWLGILKRSPKAKLARRWFRHEVQQPHRILCLSGMRHLLQRCPKPLLQCGAKVFLCEDCTSVVYRWSVGYDYRDWQRHDRQADRHRGLYRRQLLRSRLDHRRDLDLPAALADR